MHDKNESIDPSVIEAAEQCASLSRELGAERDRDYFISETSLDLLGEGAEVNAEVVAQRLRDTAFLLDIALERQRIEALGFAEPELNEAVGLAQELESSLRVIADLASPSRILRAAQEMSRADDGSATEEGVIQALTQWLVDLEAFTAMLSDESSESNAESA